MVEIIDTKEAREIENVKEISSKKLSDLIADNSLNNGDKGRRIFERYSNGLSFISRNLSSYQEVIDSVQELTRRSFEGRPDMDARNFRAINFRNNLQDLYVLYSELARSNRVSDEEIQKALAVTFERYFSYKEKGVDSNILFTICRFDNNTFSIFPSVIPVFPPDLDQKQRIGVLSFAVSVTTGKKINDEDVVASLYI